MKKNKIFLIPSILIIISLFATAAACNLCGIPIEIGETTEEETERKTETGQQTTVTTQGQPQGTEVPANGNNPPSIREIEFMGMDVEYIESEGGFDEMAVEGISGVTITIEAHDEDGDELTYVAYDSLDNNFDVTKIDDNNAEFLWEWRAEPGTYTLTIEVSDGRGGTDSRPIDMNFVEIPEEDGAVDFGEAVNNDPVITRGILIENLPGVDSPEGGPYVEGGIHYRVSVEAHDPDGDPLTYEWRGGGEYGFSDNRVNPTEWITPDISASSFTLAIHVYVRDGRGGEAVNSLADVVVE